jgi:hypothetical protein
MMQPWPDHPGPVGGNGVYCRVCGSTPAVHVTFRGHRGMIVIMQFLRRFGPFCRDCGLATYRDMTSKSLVEGWWGPMSLFVNPITMLTNLGPRSRVALLPAPVAGAPRRPLDPGKPMTQRPAMLMVLLPLILVGLPFLATIVLVIIGLLFGDHSSPTYTSMPGLSGFAEALGRQ